MYELIRNDIFLLKTNVKNQFLLELLDINNLALLHSMLSLISVIVSTLKGIEYMMVNGKEALVEIIKIMKSLSRGHRESTNPVANSVNLRFTVAIC